MKNYLTETETKTMEKTEKGKIPYMGELYPEIFNEDEIVVKNGDVQLNVAICRLGEFKLKSSLFQRVVCPVCGEISLIPYDCIASVLTGAHVIKFHCLNCHEKVAFNNKSYYYHDIRNYVIKHVLNKRLSNILRLKKRTTLVMNDKFLI